MIKQVRMIYGLDRAKWSTKHSAAARFLHIHVRQSKQDPIQFSKRFLYNCTKIVSFQQLYASSIHDNVLIKVTTTKRHFKKH